MPGPTGLVRGYFSAGARSWEVGSMSDNPRTEEQLRAQIAALQEQLEKRGSGAGKRAMRRAIKPAWQESPSGVRVPVTRRSAFAMWLAPVILLAPAVKSAKRLAKAVKRHLPA
jgi:hypothetical protein